MTYWGPKSAYGEKLLDPRWQKMRLAVFQRDEFACQVCFDTKATLHLHHKWYGGGEPWEVPMHALVTLCESCHEVETFTLRDYADDLTQMLKQCGAMSGQFEKLCRVIVGTTSNPLKFHEWEIFVGQIEKLLESRSGVDGRVRWDKAHDEWNE